MDKKKEIESNLIRSVVKPSYDKDVYDLIEECENMIMLFDEFKNEIVEDMCQVVGLYVDRYAMDQYENGQKEKMNETNATIVN